MLVLSRNIGQEIFITTPRGERIVITVVDAKPGKARIGVDAPADISVHRSEVAERIEAGLPLPSRGERSTT